MSWLSVSEDIYAQGCTRDAGEVEETPCQHIFGCDQPGSVVCDCGERICKSHILRCQDCDLEVCQGGCSITSVYDQKRRCFSCNHDHSLKQLRKGRAA